MAQGDNLGAKFTLDITNLKAGLADANKLIRQTESEFIESAAALGDWSKSADGLTARFDTLNKEIDIQKQKIQSLIAVRNETIEKMKQEGAASEDIAAVADRVNSQLAKEYKSLETLQGKADKAGKELNDFNKSENAAANGADNLADETTKAGNAAKKAGDGFTVFKGVLSNLASSAIKGVTTGLIKGVANIGKTAKSLVSDVVNAGDEIAKNSQKLGFTSKTAFQEWDYVLQRTGADIESLKKGFVSITTAAGELSDASKKTIDTKAINKAKLAYKDAQLSVKDAKNAYKDAVKEHGKNSTQAQKAALKVQKAQQKLTETQDAYKTACEGSTPKISAAASAIQSLGVDVKDVNGEMRAQEDIFADVVSALSKIDDESEKAAKAQAIFGKNFTELRPLLNGGAESVDELRKKAHELGVVMSDEMLDDSENLQDALTDFNSSIDGLKNKVVGGFLPSITGVIGGLTQIFSGNDIEAGIKKISGGVGDIAKKLLENAPTFAKTATAILGALLSAFKDSAPMISQALGTLVKDGLPMILSFIFDTLGVIINDVVSWLNNGDNLQTMIDGIVKFAANLAENAGVILETLLPAVVKIITGVISALSTPENIELLIKAALSLAKSVFLALVETVPVLIDFCKNMIKNLAGLFADFLGRAVPFVADSIEKIVNTVKSWFEKLKELPAQMLEIGKDIIRGIVNGMTDNAIIKWLGEKLKGIGQTFVNGLKSFFKIKSPSGLMRDLIGRNLARGVVVGWENELSSAAREMQSSLNAAIPTINAGFGATPESAENGTQAGGVVVYQTNNYSQAHTRFEMYQSKQATAAAVRAALAGV